MRKPKWGGLYGLLSRRFEASPITNIYRVGSRVIRNGEVTKVVYPVNSMIVSVRGRYAYDIKMVDGRWTYMGTHYVFHQ